MEGAGEALVLVAVVGTLVPMRDIGVQWITYLTKLCILPLRQIYSAYDGQEITRQCSKETEATCRHVEMCEVSSSSQPRLGKV